MARLSLSLVGSRNTLAFLDMLAVSEGTAGHGDDGYDVLVGGALFQGYAEHPNRRVWLPRLGIYSTAAGRYQFLARTWDDLRRKLALRDFGPESQDLAAIELIRECRALDDIHAGRFDAAVYACRRIWASLPGAGYGQRENKLSALRFAYRSAGGVMAGEAA